MKKAMILNIDNGVALVMEDGGHFRKVPARQHWEKGDLVTLNNAGGAGGRVRYLLQHWAVNAVGVFLILAILSYTYYYYTGKTISTVSIDINPSIQLSLNMQDRVISATAFNEDGVDLLEGMKLAGLTAKDAILAIINSDALQPYLQLNPTVVLGVSSSGRQNNVEWQVYEAVIGFSGAHEEVGFMLNELAWDLLEEARNLDVSPGKLTLVLQARENDPSLSLEKLVGLGTDELLQLLNEQAGSANE